MLARPERPGEENTMPEAVKLYFFSSGTTKTKVHFFKMHQGLNEPFEIPMPWFLIVHPKGNVIIDGGNTLALARDPYHWEDNEDFWPVMTEAQHCVNELKQMDVDPDSIRYVFQSHLHTDHCGALGHFPHARFIVQRRELEYAYTHDWYVAGIYIREDFDYDVDWLFLDGEHDDGYDIYGDGVIRTMFTPGHSPGHTSVVVSLPQTGPVMLTMDACFTRDHYENRAMPGILHSAADVVASVAKIRRVVEKSGAMLVPGHDPDEWPRFLLAPKFYG
jgi:N-acyl homoserine lactone hydrolase